jgi:hypothetical protein
MGTALPTDSAEFEEMIRPHLGYLYGLALRLSGPTDAEDLVQNGLLKAFRAFPGLRNRERPRLWLTRVITQPLGPRRPPEAHPWGGGADVITCREAVARLWEYRDRNLGQVEGDELDEHLGVCRHCCGELEFGRRIREMLRRGGDRSAELAPEVHERLETFLRTVGKRQ